MLGEYKVVLRIDVDSTGGVSGDGENALKDGERCIAIDA